MLQNIIHFISTNLLDILLVIVGASAFGVYLLQERRKISDAASLIVLQVEDIQKRIREIGSFIVEGQLNFTAFYESQMLFKTDYWNEYKHYFIRKMDAFSFSTFDEFYNCASGILEQQQLMKNLQKNFFFLTQQMIMQMETNTVMQALPFVEQKINMESEKGAALEDMIKQAASSNSDIDWKAFWSFYGKRKENIYSLINQKALTDYTPMQIRITLDNALKRSNSIQIIGCEGYRKLKKIANTKI